MGLLTDNLGIDDPNTTGLLSLGLRLMSTPGKFGAALGQAGLGAMGDVRQAQQLLEMKKARDQQAQEQALRQRMLEMQLAQAQQAQAEAQRAREQEEAFRKLIPNPGFQAGAAALAGGGGPTMANAAQVRSMDPQQQLLYGAMVNGQIKPMEYITATQKDRTPIKLGKDDRLLEPGTNRVLVDAMPDPTKGSQIAQLMAEMNALPPGDPRRATYQNAITKATTHQPATNVTVTPDNLGLKPKDRFEMEQKLGADYSAVTKLDSGIVSTAQDIRNILQQGGALKDQAAIYKFAKALDPDGAVREADYAAIVKTAGGLDYVKALFNKALTGEQLSPKQRIEMTNLTNAMAAVAQQRIAKAQARFTSNAKLYNLNPENVFQVQSNDGWSIEK
jgi:hypothetical protein